MDWGIELWDQFDNIDKHHQYGIDFAERYSKFIKERCAIESEYASKLRKLVKNYQPKKKDEERSMFSTNKAFAVQLSELNDIAGQHETVAEDMMNNINKALIVFCNELKNEKKKLFQDGRHNQADLEQQEKLLDQTKRKFEKEWKDCERAHAHFEKLDNDLNVTKIDVEKARQAWNTRKDTVEACKTDYAATLNSFNKYQHDHYNTKMPELFMAYKTADERRVVKSREMMMEYIKIETGVAPLIEKCMDGMSKAASAIDPKLDAQLVVEKLKSGFLLPSDKEFEDCTQPQQQVAEGGETLPANSINPNRHSNKRSGFGRFFNKKVNKILSSRGTISQLKDSGEAPSNGSKPKLSTSPDLKRENNLSQTSVEEKKANDNKDTMLVQKSRTLSAPASKNFSLGAKKDPKLSEEDRSLSMEAINKDDKSSGEQIHRKNAKGKSNFRMSMPVNKKRLKAMFKTNKDEHMPKIEVSGPITCDLMGSSANDDYLVPIPKSPQKEHNSEHPYDQVAVDGNHNGKPVIKDREGSAESPDYSHLPPEQRRKKLQRLIDDIRKDITKEEESRKAIFKMQDVYRKNPALGDANSLEGQLASATVHLDKLEAELAQLEKWHAETTGSVKLAPDRNRPSSQRSTGNATPSTHISPHHSNKHNKHDHFGDDFDEEPEPIGTCVALYDFEATSDGALNMKVGDKFSVIEADNGDGWTRAMNGDVDGYVPTSYIEIDFFT